MKLRARIARSTRSRWVVAAVLLGAACARPAPDATLHEGDPAPDFEAVDLAGRSVKLSTLEGRVRLVDFWATWCPPCREEIPLLNELHAAYAEQGLSILAVTDEPAQVVGEFAAETPMRYTNLVDAGAVAEDYRVIGLPTAFLIDREGKIVEMLLGPKPRQVLESRIRELLGLPPAA